MAQRVNTSAQEISTTNTTDQDLPNIVRYWILRLLVELKVDQHFIKRHGFRDDDIASQIGLGEYVNDDFDSDIEPTKMRKILRKMYRDAQRNPGTVPEVLTANVERIADLVNLNPVESRLFEFAILMRAYPALKEMCEKPSNLRRKQLADRMATLLDLPRQATWDAFQPDATLARTGLLTLTASHHYTGSIEAQLELLSESLPDRLTDAIVAPTDWLRDMVRASEPGHLQWSDYQHLAKPLSVLRPYLNHALQTGRKGVNILMYGPPGTGKTQLSKLLAQDMGCELFEVTTEDESKDPITGRKRVKAHCAANSFFAKHRALILFDEVEEVFNDNEGSGGFLKLLRGETQQHSRKGWMNQVLESNALPTIWVANSLRGLDPAFARRFDMVMDMPVPPKSHRERIIKGSAGDLLNRDAITRMAESEDLAPAVVAKAVSVVQCIADQMQPHRATEAVEMLVNNTLQAQHHRPIARHNPNRLPEIYDPAFIHADIDLNEVAKQLVQVRTGRLCLYGPPGTGKTAFGRWLADQMGAPLLVKRASDLLGMYVGESEKNIAHAFEQAEAENAVLLVDEVDSFLQDRQGAQRSWEVSLVNEMLTQMESFGGVFIASTNLMGQLDAAVLRRFDLKVKLKAMRPEQAAQLLQRHCQQQGLEEPNPSDLTLLQSLSNLTPGDFAAVLRQSRLRPLRSASDWVKALQGESAIKPDAQRKTIGFVQ
jgi:transitional endoplasmic reticulum ATPase